MKTSIVADGESRFLGSPGFQARLDAVRNEVYLRYAMELAQAGWFRRMIIRWRISREVRREVRKIQPSPESLYSSRIRS